MTKTSRCQELTRATGVVLTRALCFTLGVVAELLDWGRAVLLTAARIAFGARRTTTPRTNQGTPRTHQLFTKTRAPCLACKGTD
jgi:hypothetical protein